MSGMKELVDRYCCEGVKKIALIDLLDYESTTKCIARCVEYNNAYTVPVLTADSNFILGYTNEIDGIYVADSNNPIIIFDDFTTSFYWVDFCFKVKNSAIKILKLKDGVVDYVVFKYVYYAMCNLHYEVIGHSRNWISKYSKLEIPLPCIEVQKEIVRILDSMQCLILNLQKELDVRMLQFEYYRDKFFDFKNNQIACEYRQLKDCIDKNIGGGTPSKLNPNYWNGKIPWASVKDLTERTFVLDNTRESITEDGLLNSSSNMVKANSVIVAIRNIPGKMVVNNKDVAINQDLRGLYLKPWVNNYYLTYFFQTIDVVGIGSIVKRMLIQDLERIEVPIPSEDDQRKIVKILNTMRELQDVLNEEIEMRHKQYVYYREKLLSFDGVKII